MTTEQANKLQMDWKLRGDVTLTCTHRILEVVNGNIPPVYICVRCGDPATINPVQKQ